MVVLDFFLCYRVPFLIKMYCLMLAGYIYLGTHQGDDITTTHNGGLLSPKWPRLDYIQWTAFLEAAAWVLIESVLVGYALFIYGTPDRSSVEGQVVVACRKHCPAPVSMGHGCARSACASSLRWCCCFQR